MVILVLTSHISSLNVGFVTLNPLLLESSGSMCLRLLMSSPLTWLPTLGPISYFLDIEVAYFFRGYLISQKMYTSDLLVRACLIDDCTLDIPWMTLHPIDGVPLICWGIGLPTLLMLFIW